MTFKEIVVKEFKEHGLEIAEDMAEVAVKGVFTACKEVIRETPTKIDDMTLPLVELVEKKALSFIDSIDGEIEK